MTFLLNMVIGLFSKRFGDPSLSLLLPPVMLFVVIGFTLHFHNLVSKRYPRWLLVGLDLGYFFGQIMLCLALWIGSCSLFFTTLNLH